MRAQVVNNCQGPHYIQGQKNGNAPGALLILRPGLNLVDSKQLADLRKANKSFDDLFVAKVKPSKAIEAAPNIKNFNKPMLEIRGKELDEKAGLGVVPHAEAKEMIALTEDTDLLKSWIDSCDPKNAELMRALNARVKEITGGILARAG